MPANGLTLQQMFQHVVDDSGQEMRIRSYSGRCMYGKECMALVCENYGQVARVIAGVMRLVCEQAENKSESPVEVDDVEIKLGRMRMDSMGCGIVAYWPDIPFEKDADDDEDDADAEDDAEETTA